PCRAGLDSHAAHPRRGHTLLGRGAPGQRRFLWLRGRIPGRPGGYPLQRGGRVCAAPLRRGDAVVAGRDAQGADEGLHHARHQPGAVCSRHGCRLALSALLFKAGTLTIGTVYLIFQCTEMLRQPTEQIRNEVQDLQQADASIARIEALLGTAPRVADGPGVALPPGPLAVELDDVSFGYAKDAPV